MSYGYWPTQQGARQLCGKYSVTLMSEEELHDTPEVMVRKFEIADDKVYSETRVIVHLLVYLFVYSTNILVCFILCGVVSV